MIKVVFYILAFTAIISAVYVATIKNVVRSIFMFFVTLFSLAGLYVIALADFVAVTQIVIYVGGILVLILFAFMLSGKQTLDAMSKQQSKFISISNIPALLLSMSFLAILIFVYNQWSNTNPFWIDAAIGSGNEIRPNDISVENIGINLMTNYLLPFEAISILLMIALVGAAHLARKEPQL